MASSQYAASKSPYKEPAERMDRSYKIPAPILDDLCSRFILNVPDDDRDIIIRTFFQIELAHWFYIDFFVSEDSSLKKVGIREFAKQVFAHCPFLLSSTDNVATLHEDWKAYKLSVPTYGGILLDPSMTYVLLVQGFSKNWGFPKGKVNEDEEPHKCALRELMEETGFDASGLLNPREYVEHTVGDMYSRLYIIPDVSLETSFMAQTRNEIKQMQWFPISYLPSNKKDATHSEAMGCGPNSFFMVIPFLGQLRRWISRRNSGHTPTTPKSQRRDRNYTAAQKAFLKSNLDAYEAILSDDPSPSPVGKHRTKATGSPRPGRRRQPQYTILEKDKKGEDLKKMNELRKSLDLPAAKPPAPSSPSREYKLRSSPAWTKFKFDADAIMKAAFKL